MKLQITPTVDGKVQKEFTTFRNPRTGRKAELSANDALYWGNRAIQVNEQFCKGDPGEVIVRIGD